MNAKRSKFTLCFQFTKTEQKVQKSNSLKIYCGVESEVSDRRGGVARRGSNPKLK
jgi:hypothetical protein